MQNHTSGDLGQECKATFKDTIHFPNIIRHAKLDLQDILVTTDVCLLYTDIPHYEDIASLIRMMNEMGSDTHLLLLRSNQTHEVLTRNYFNNQLYRQIHGPAYGTRMAPNYDIILMYYLGESLLHSNTHEPKLWVRYMDDIFMIWSHSPEKLKDFITHLKFNFHATIKVTHTQSTKELLGYLSIQGEEQ